MFVELDKYHKSSYAFYIDMNLLFEKYVSKIIQKKLISHNVNLQPIEYFDEEKQIKIKPDILIEKDQNPVLVIDTKYKNDEKPTNEDINQINSYMTKFKIDGILLYPNYKIKENIHTLAYNKLFIKTIDISNLEKGTEELITYLKEFFEKNILKKAV